MKYTKALVPILAASLTALAACSQRGEETAHAQEPSADSTYGTASEPDRTGDATAAANPEGDGSSVPADNTGVNKRDRNDANLTPEDQSQSPEDLDLARRVRQSITSDDTLSVDGKNVKVITRGGIVTLRGPVKSDAERTAIGDKATLIAGTGKVENLLEVVP